MLTLRPRPADPTAVPAAPAVMTFSGPTVEEALRSAAAALGTSDIDVVDARRLRRGGVGGFFARETYEVVVRLRSPLPPAPGAPPPADPAGSRPPEVTTGPDGSPGRTTVAPGGDARARIDAVLARLAAQVDAAESAANCPTGGADPLDVPTPGGVRADGGRPGSRPGPGAHVVDLREPGGAAAEATVRVPDAHGHPAPPHSPPAGGDGTGLRLVSLNDDRFWADKVADARALLHDAPGPRRRRRVGPAEPAWSRDALIALGIPREVLGRLPVEDPESDLQWTAAMERALRAVLPEPVDGDDLDPGLGAAVVDAHGVRGIGPLVAACMAGALPGRIHLPDGRTRPATATELTLAVRASLCEPEAGES